MAENNLDIKAFEVKPDMDAAYIDLVGKRQTISWILFLILLLAAFLLPPTVLAKDTLYWQNINWPPFQILQGEDAGKGRIDVLIKLLQDQLPQYDHQNVEMNWSRYWEDVKAGKHVLNSMAIKTEERSQYTVFSKTMSFALPFRIILKKSTLNKLGNPKSAAFADFVKNKNIHGIIEQKRSYSVPIDGILNKTNQENNLIRRAIGVEQILKMILSERVDYTLEYPMVVDYLVKRFRLDSGSPLVSIPIEELPRYVTAHVAAPKNEWGVKVIKDINKIIDNIKTTSQYLEIHKMWHSDARELALVESIYKDLFLGRGQTVVISGIINEQTHAMAKEVLREAYNRIGYDVIFKLWPGKRSLDFANQGKTDGDIARIKGTEKAFPNLIMVPTPVIDFQGIAFTKSVSREINSWKDLKGLKVGVIRGIRYSNIGTRGLDPFFAEDMTHLLRLLADDRIEVAVAVLKAGKIEIQKHFQNSGIHTIGRPLFSAPLFHFVHKKNNELAADLNRVLQDMEQKGEIKELVDRSFQKLLSNEVLPEEE